MVRIFVKRGPLADLKDPLKVTKKIFLNTEGIKISEKILFLGN